jgi:hypothetical protein
LNQKSFPLVQFLHSPQTVLLKVLKLSFVLTITTLWVGLLAISGCAHHGVARTQTPVKTASANSTETVNAPLLTPKNFVYPAPAQSKPAPISPVVTGPPPPPQVEVVGAPPGPKYTWLPGHWEWQGSWTWISGKWGTLPEPNAAWIPGRWVHRENGWIWVTGYWRVASL